MYMKGFTLLEVLLYTSLFSIIMTGLFISTALLQDTGTEVRMITAKIQALMSAADGADEGVHVLTN
jgi:type II secretory pathway component PulJ